MDSSTLTSSVLVWATRSDLAEALVAALQEPGRVVCQLEQDADLISAHSYGSLLVADLEPRLEQQQAFVRGPLVLLDPNRAAPRELARRAYAVVSTVSEATLAVDRFFEHRRLAQAAANRRVMPGRCSRCGRPFDGARARSGSTARRFVRFGSIALCGSCVEELRKLLRASETAVVEADT